MPNTQASPELVVFGGEVPATDYLEYLAAGPQLWADLLIRTALEQAKDKVRSAQLAQMLAQRALGLSVLFRPEIEGDNELIHYPIHGSLAMSGDTLILTKGIPGLYRHELAFARTSGETYQLADVRTEQNGKDSQAWHFNRPLRPEAAERVEGIIATLHTTRLGVEIVEDSLTTTTHMQRFAEVTIEPTI